MKKVRFLLQFAAAITLSAAIFTGCSDDDDDSGPLSPATTTTIEIGAIIPFSGDYGHHGQQFSAAVECAAEDVNTALKAAGSDTTIEVIFGDSMTDGVSANAVLKSFVMQDIRGIIGPFTSPAVEASAATIGESDSFLISPSSTMTSLAGSDDHIFRLVRDDTHMADALADRMIADGITHLLMIARNDSWGKSASAAVADAFTEKGGTVIHKWDSMHIPEIILLTLDDLAAVLPVQQERYGADKVAIHLTSYDEGVDIFDVAADRDVLATARWYGSDGFVNDSTLLENRDAAAFAVAVNYEAPFYHLAVADGFESVITRIENKAGKYPDTFALNAYDALRVAADAIVNAGSEADYNTLENALISSIAGYSGLTGTIKLDANGDRTDGDYSFFSVVDNGTAYSWTESE